MKNLIEQLSYIVPAISIGFLLVITSINVYFKIRRKFPAIVNCWFCNVNTKVPYEQSNSWICPSCEQYNGFTEDGDYNCDIPSQRSSKLNKRKNCSVSSANGSANGSSSIAPTNGLCQPCNRNQELKMQQLKSFEPENESYFDEEVEEYRFKLEQAYRLCPRCERHLKRTLNRVKNNILGSKLAQIGANGLQAFNLHSNGTITNGNVARKRQFFAKICLFSLVLMSALQLFQSSQSINITKAKLDSAFTSSTSTSILLILSYVSAIKLMAAQFVSYVTTLPYIAAIVVGVKLCVNYLYISIGANIWNVIDAQVFDFIDATGAVNELSQGMKSDEAIITNIAGCFLSTFAIFAFGLKIGPVLSLLLWSLNMAMPLLLEHLSEPINALIYDAIKICIIWTSTSLSIVNLFTICRKGIEADTNKNNSFHRIYSECESDVSDESDVESELNTSLQSNASLASLRSKNSFRTANSTLHGFNNTTLTSTALYRRPFASSTTSLQAQQGNRNEKFELQRNFQRNSQMDLSRANSDRNQSAFAMASDFVPFDIYNRKQLNTSQYPTIVNANSQLNLSKGSEFGLRCSSRNSCHDIPDDFESGITQLSISGIGGKRFSHKNQVHALSTFDTMSSMLQRKQILLPSRLGNNICQKAAAHQTSWLAGGYWNTSTSPQKKQKINRQMCNGQVFAKATEVFPIISRTSSQSSGFESMKNGTENNSTENSLYDECEDVNSVFSDPAMLAKSTKNTNALFMPLSQSPPNTYYYQPTTYSELDKNHQLFLHQASATPIQSIKSLPNLSRNSNAFDTFTLQKQLPSTPIQFQHCNNTLTPNYDNNNHTTYSNNFKKFNNGMPLPTFQKGCLLKIPEATVVDNKDINVMNELDFCQ